MDEPVLWIQVKKVTSERHRKMASQLEDLEEYPSKKLTKLWWLFADMPTLDDELPLPAGAPTPGYRNGSSDFHLKKRRLLRDIESLLAELESLKVWTTNPHSHHGTREEWVKILETCERFRARIGPGVHANAREPFTSMPPGIYLGSGYGFTRTEKPNTIAKRLNEYLKSDKGASLRRQLGEAPEGAIRHAFLLIDYTEPEYDAWLKWEPTETPAFPLDLPPMIDAVWVTGMAGHGGPVYFYDRSAGKGYSQPL